jgi:tRNA_anti-like
MLANRLVVLGLAAALVVGCAKKEDPPKNTQGINLGRTDDTKPKKELKEVDLATVKPDFSLTAEDWFKEWGKDEKLARQKYQGKIIELTGDVEIVDDHPNGEAGIVYLKVGRDNVTCYTADKEPWLKAGPGQKAKIRGKVPDDGFWGKPYNLYPCAVIEGTPPPTFSAEQLAKEFTADRKVFEEKYDHKQVLVEGAVAAKTVDGNYGKLMLKGGGDQTVSCTLGMLTDFQKRRYESIKVGQQVKLCGEVSVTSTGKQVNIERCMMGNPPR